MSLGPCVHDGFILKDSQDSIYNVILYLQRNSAKFVLQLNMYYYAKLHISRKFFSRM